MLKVKVSMTIDEAILQSFREYCGHNGMKMSTKVELLMRESMKNESLRKFV
jgi:antitoxin component of RelBE/YafQ-DinJ toxin-antitoxin module